MGGVSIDTGGGGGKKSVDLIIPLVPFIDMLAMMITFLMMTAVWTQIGKLQVAQQGGPSDASNQPPTPTLQLNLTVTERGYLLSAGGPPVELPKASDGGYDTTKLLENLKTVTKDFPDHRSITIGVEDGVEYQFLVRTVDACIGAGLPDVTVQAAVG